MAAVTSLAPKTAAALVGKEWSAATVHAACTVLQDELRVVAGAPGGQSEYRMALASSFLFKHFVATSIELHEMHGGAGGAGACRLRR